MDLTYRGNAYEMPNPIQPDSDSTDQPKVKLIYRGHTYHTTPRSVVPEAIETNAPTVTFIYRGTTYEHKLQSPKPDQQPRGINWRYQIPGEG